MSTEADFVVAFRHQDGAWWYLGAFDMATSDRRNAIYYIDRPTAELDAERVRAERPTYTVQVRRVS